MSQCCCHLLQTRGVWVQTPLRAYIIPSSGHWTNLSILTFWHLAPSGGQKTHSAPLRATEPALLTVTLKTPLDYLLFFLKNFASTDWFGSAAWHRLPERIYIKPCGIVWWKSASPQQWKHKLVKRKAQTTDTAWILSHSLVLSNSSPPPQGQHTSAASHSLFFSFLYCTTSSSLWPPGRFLVFLLFIPHCCLLS